MIKRQILQNNSQETRVIRYKVLLWITTEMFQFNFRENKKIYQPRCGSFCLINAHSPHPAPRSPTGFLASPETHFSAPAGREWGLVAFNLSDPQIYVYLAQHDALGVAGDFNPYLHTYHIPAVQCSGRYASEPTTPISPLWSQETRSIFRGH